MGLTSLDIKNNLYVDNDKIINMQDFNSEKLSIVEINNNKNMSIMMTIHFFLSIDNLKGSFEEHDDKNNILGRFKDKDNIVGKAKKIKYLTIIFTSEYQKLMYTKIFKKINKDINENYVKIRFDSNDNVPLNILINIHNLVLAVRFYLKSLFKYCWYDQFYEGIQIQDATK